MMMKVKMLRGKLGSNDGVTTKFYDEGEEYEVSEGLGKCFLEEKVAELIEQDGQKAKPAAPANKAVSAAPENKAA